MYLCSELPRKPCVSCGVLLGVLVASILQTLRAPGGWAARGGSGAERPAVCSGPASSVAVGQPGVSDSVLAEGSFPSYFSDG